MRSAGQPGGSAAGKERIWSRTFGLLCVAQMMGYGHQGMMNPIVPLFVVSLGYTEVTVGLVLALFSVTSFTIRPLIGLWADTWSVRGVLGIGGLLLGVGGAALAAPIVWTIGLANAVRGIGWSAHNTGGNTLLAHIAPPARRGEAASFVSVFQNVPASLTPLLAFWLLAMDGSQSNFGVVFGAASLMGFLVLATAWQVPRDAAPASAKGQPEGSGFSRLLDRNVLLPGVLLFCLTVIGNTMNAFVPLFARSLGIGVESVGWYYVVLGITQLFGRSLLGQVSDTLGRGAALVGGFLAGAVALGIMAAANSLPMLLLAGVLYALAQSLHQPATMALAMDRADPRRRGAAMASFSLWFQIGNGLGAPLAGLTADLAGYRAMYLLALLGPLSGLLTVLVNRAALGRPKTA